MPDTFRALIAEGDSKQYSVDFKDIPNGSLPAGEVLIQAMYSSLNYKDGLAITRRGKVIRKFPMVLGVDLAGKVLESNTGEFKVGDEVLVRARVAQRWGSPQSACAFHSFTRLFQGLNCKGGCAPGFSEILARVISW